MRLQKNRYLKQVQELALPLSSLKGVGPKRAAQFARKGIHTVLDLLFFTPLRYEDRTCIRPIGEAQGCAHSLVQGKVVRGGEQKLFPSRSKVFKVLLTDTTGAMELVWFHYRKPHLMRFIAPGTELLAFGTAKENRGNLQMVHPEVWNYGSREESLGFYPVYSSLPGVPPALLRSLIRKALDQHLGAITDPVPERITRSLGLPHLGEALRHVHFPPQKSFFPSLNERHTPHHRRLLFDRFFLFMLAIAFRRASRKGQEGQKWAPPPGFMEDLTRFFPFTLTGGQEKALQDILQDFVSRKPMNRLILGDVGCGKTAVAAAAAYVAIKNQAKVAVMAPTQVLATQHFQTFSSLPPGMGLRPMLLTGALKKVEKEEAYDKILSESCNLVIGTQALIQEGFRFPGLGLVIIDEQQRFGVRERALMDRKGKNPHLLVMTATPIPRTLAMTVYGDMDISLIREYPANHKPVVTRLVPETEKRKVLDFLKERLTLGQQAFVICPVIEESEEQDLKSALETAAKLKKILSPPFRVGLMHGRLPSHEKDAVMDAFRCGRCHILVGTTVVEVGLHVPAATVMIIEHPERFGLAQLHQLRGRVGRGSTRGVCLLMASSGLSEKALSRLKIMTESVDGFEIAQKDLEQRGQGELTGMRQAGLGELELQEMMSDPDLLHKAKEAADALLDLDPDLALPHHQGLKGFIDSILARPIDL